MIPLIKISASAGMTSGLPLHDQVEDKLLGRDDILTFYQTITFALNYYFGGFEVWGYHLVNLVIHGVTGILVFWFVWLTFHLPSQRERYGALGLRVAFFSALIFVSHPVQ